CRLTAVGGGFNVLFFSTPVAGATFWPRQMFVRFDKDDHAVEVRVRYENGLVPATKERPALLDVLKRTAGAPEKLTPTWANVWTDLPGTRAATYYRWSDDRTLATFHQHPSPTHTVLRASPPDP